MLVTDRKTGLLGLYLAAPLTRPTYLLGKIGALLVVLLIVTVGPLLLVLIGFIFAEIGPDGFTEFLATLGRILVSGVALSAYFTAIALAVSSMTRRNGFASAGIIVLMVASTILANVVRDTTDVGSWVRLFDLFGLPFDIVSRIYGVEAAWPETSTVTSVAGFVGVIAISMAITWFRVAKTQVTK